MTKSSRANVIRLVALALLAGGCAARAPRHFGAGADLASVGSLETALERASARVRELEDAPVRVLAVKRLYEGEPGGTARVVLLDTDRGEKIGKLSYVRTVSDRVVPWILQDHASRAGLAPALHKIIEGPALAALLSEQPLLAQLRSPWPHLPESRPISLVLMDVVHDGFSFLQHARSRRSLERYPPAMVPSWARRLGDIEAYFNRHNVQLCDEQFLIQPVGGLMVIDFDHYTFVDSRNRRWAYKGVTDYPDVEYWKTPTPAAKLNDVSPIVAKLHALYTAP
jgi:hypothetical protein